MLTIKLLLWQRGSVPGKATCGQGLHIQPWRRADCSSQHTPDAGCCSGNLLPFPQHRQAGELALCRSPSMLMGCSRGQGQISPFGGHTEGLTSVSHLG